MGTKCNHCGGNATEWRLIDGYPWLWCFECSYMTALAVTVTDRGNAADKVCAFCNGSGEGRNGNGNGDGPRPTCFACEGTGICKTSPQPQPRPRCGTCDQYFSCGVVAGPLGDVMSCEVCGRRKVEAFTPACCHHQDFAAWRESRRTK